MKRTLLILFSLIVVSSCRNNDVDTRIHYIPNFNNFAMREVIGYGPIKKCTEYFYFDNVKEEYGQIVLGRFDYTYTYVFDTNGRIIECNYPGQRDTYDYKDNQCVFNSYYEKKLSQRIVNYYNGEQQIIKQERYNNQRELIGLYTYKYNENGDEIELFDSVANNTLYKNTIKYEYDNQNRITRKKYIIDPSRKLQKFSYTTENIHTPIHIYKYSDNSTILLMCDESGNVVNKKVTTPNGIVDSLFRGKNIDRIVKYDSNLNIIEEKSWYEYNGKNYISTQCTYKYIFDERGNWIKKEAYRRNKEIPTNVTIREIEYY